MGSLVNTRSLSLAALLLAFSATPARAAGRLLSRGGTGVQLHEARSALTRGPMRTTVWHQLQLEGSAEELLWLLPIPPEVSVDVSTASFFDAIEESTAPRVLAPTLAAPKHQTCSQPSPETISSGDIATTLSLLGQEVFSEATTIQPKIEQLGYPLTPAELSELTTIVNKGNRLLALRLAAPTKPSATITVRLHGANADLGAIPLMNAPSKPIPWVLWMMGDARGKVQGLGEIAIGTAVVRWLNPTNSSYSALRDSMLTKAHGASVLLQVAGTGPLRDITALPGGNSIPPFLDAYLRRIFERGETSGDLGGFSDGAHEAIEGALPDGCPRGDLLSAEGLSCPSPGAKDPLVPSPAVDDLAFVFAGNAPLRWVSRVEGLLPAQATIPAISVAFPGGGLVSLLVSPANVWDGLCSVSTPDLPGQGGAANFGGTNGTGAGGPVPSGGGKTLPPLLDDDATETNCSCVNVFVEDSCTQSSPGSSSSEGCNCDDTSSSRGNSEDDGCGCGDPGNDGDSCSGSSTQDDSGDSCSGSEGSGGGDSCGSSGSSSGGDSCGKDCSISRRRRSPRLSKWLLVIAATALPFRRWSRPRNRKRRKFRVIG